VRGRACETAAWEGSTNVNHVPYYKTAVNIRQP